jgi:hypothetical protein
LSGYVTYDIGIDTELAVAGERFTRKFQEHSLPTSCRDAGPCGGAAHAPILPYRA